MMHDALLAEALIPERERQIRRDRLIAEAERARAQFTERWARATAEHRRKPDRKASDRKAA
jgi:hypothetical protein